MSGCNIPEPSKVPQAPERGEKKDMNNEEKIAELYETLKQIREERDAMEREMKHWYNRAKSYERTILRLVTALTREDDDDVE